MLEVAEDAGGGMEVSEHLVAPGAALGRVCQLGDTLPREGRGSAGAQPTPPGPGR